MSERLVDGARIKQLAEDKGFQPELFAGWLEMCMTDYRKMLSKGELPKKRREWRIRKLAEHLGVSIDQILIPTEASKRTA